MERKDCALLSSVANIKDKMSAVNEMNDEITPQGENRKLNPVSLHLKLIYNVLCRELYYKVPILKRIQKQCTPTDPPWCPTIKSKKVPPRDE